LLRNLTALAFVTFTIASIGRAEAAPVTSYSLDNGMDIVVIEDHRAPVVTHMVWYRAGGADERPGKSGVAHFLEHLMFKATDDLASGEFSKIVAANGGRDNAFTSHDYTAYFQRIIADRLEMVMEMEADRMVDLALIPEDIPTERNVVLEERNQRVENNPGALFSEHVEPEEVKRLAEIHYGPLKPSENLPERARPSEPPQLSARRLTFNDPRVRQPYVIRSYLATERNSSAQEEAAALTILAELLGGSGITSVMGKRLQIEEQLAISAGAFYSGSGLDKQSFGVYVVPASGVSLQEAEDGMDAAIAAGFDPRAYH